MSDPLDEGDSHDWTDIREQLDGLIEDIEGEAEEGSRDYHEALYELERSIEHYEHALQSYYIEKDGYGD